MQVKTISTTAVQLNGAPFCEGFSVAGVVFGAGKIQGSDDGTTYSDLVTGTTGDLTVAQITVKKYMKTDTGAAYLLGNV